MRRAIIAIACVVFMGCLETEDSSSSLFRQPAPLAALPPTAPASTETAARVDSLGRRILAANPAIGARPLFHTIGAPQPEVFHRGMADVFVTEGLVQQCDDNQLAAVLCSELGKMVREREAATPASVRAKDNLPPMDARLGQDDQMRGTADRTDLYEYIKFDSDRKTRRGSPKLPDANILACEYLANTGFRPDAMTAAGPILRSASNEMALERQITAQQQQPPPVY